MKIRKAGMLFATGIWMICMMTGCGTKDTIENSDAVQKVTENTQTMEIVQTETTESMSVTETSQMTEDFAVDDSTEETIKEIPAQEEVTEIISDGEIKNYNGVIVLDGVGYELYTYTESYAKVYTQTINELAEALDGEATVYDLIVPLSSGITFPDNLRKEISSSNQEDANAAIMSMFDDKVQKVDIFSTMMQHRAEYIYYRTDHHWTALGAYYAYTDFCKVKGIEPEDLDSYEKKDYGKFVGSFYKDTNDESVRENADNLEAYIPNCKSIMHVEPAKGDAYDWNVVADVSEYKPGIKYSAFIAGDNPYTVITNKDITDGSSCILVKESFGNAFAPFLVDHYQYVYVIDYRYWTGNIKELAEEKNVSDVIFVNNISMVRNKYLIGQLRKITN